MTKFGFRRLNGAISFSQLEEGGIPLSEIIKITQQQFGEDLTGVVIRLGEEENNLSVEKFPDCKHPKTKEKIWHSCIGCCTQNNCYGGDNTISVICEDCQKSLETFELSGTKDRGRKLW